MKATLLSLAAVALLAGGAGAGFTAKSNELKMQDTVKAQLQIQKQMTMQINKLEAQMLKSQIELLESQVWEKEDVSENFIITEIENGSVRGKLADGTGEGIFYPMAIFETHGFSDVKINDEYTITWSGDAYDNENWEIIKEIGKIVK